jgi:tRNA pseudouridine55 synthase
MRTLKKGILVVDKPVGLTSHDVVDQVRRITGIKRVGHAGTLDPFATGILLIMIGQEATKQSVKLSRADKEYLATIEFGRTTDTLDPTGKFVDQPAKVQLENPKLKKVLQSFLGITLQQVPRFSAVKVKGKKLYQKARKGEKFVPPTKKVTIHELELLDLSQDPDNFPQAKIRVVCSSGTYIRALARDVGQKLGVPAYLVALRRIRQGKFTSDQAIPLKDFI